MQRATQATHAVALAITAGLLIACGDSSTSPLTASQYTVTALSNGMIVAGLNNAGQVVGRVIADNTTENVLITSGKTTDLGSCEPTGINTQGVIACSRGLWRDGQITPVTFPANFTGALTGVNDQGIAAGGGYYSYVQDSTACYIHSCALIATPARVTILDAPSVIPMQIPRIDNGTEVIVFSRSGQAGMTGTVWKADSTSQPYPCAGLPAASLLSAIGGNNEVVGAAVLTDDRTNTDAIVCRDGVMQSLGATTSEANDISKDGLIVGSTDDGHGFLWANGKLTILDQGLLAQAKWRVISAERVNDAGQIVVAASDGSGDTEVLLLTPR